MLAASPGLSAHWWSHQVVPEMQMEVMAPGLKAAFQEQNLSGNPQGRAVPESPPLSDRAHLADICFGGENTGRAWSQEPCSHPATPSTKHRADWGFG